MTYHTVDLKNIAKLPKNTIKEQNSIKTDVEQKSWRELRAKAQNQTATLLDMDDEEDETELIISSEQQSKKIRQNFVDKTLESNHKKQSPTSIKHQQDWQKIKDRAQNRVDISSILIKKNNLVTDYRYKLITVNKIEQLKPLQHLIPLNVRRKLKKNSKSMDLRGIVARDRQKSFAIILVDVSDSSRVAKTIHVSILPDYFDRTVGRRLVQCLTKSLPKINCDRLILNNQARIFI